MKKMRTVLTSADEIGILIVANVMAMHIKAMFETTTLQDVLKLLVALMVLSPSIALQGGSLSNWTYPPRAMHKRTIENQLRVKPEVHMHLQQPFTLC